VVEDRGELRRREVLIERHRDQPRPQRAKQRDEERSAVIESDHHALSRGKVARLKEARERGRLPIELA